MHDSPPALATLPATEISVSDEQNPRSVVNLVPPSVSERLKQHVFEHPELFDKDEHTLHKYLRAQERTPSPLDNRLRLKWWMEYDRVQARGEAQMNMVNVLAGLCSRELFYGHYLKNPNKCAWLLCPPTGYMVKAEEALEFGLEQLRDILDLPHVNYGKVDTKLADLKLKIVALLDTRVQGAIVQKNVNVNLGAQAKGIDNATAAATMEDIKKQLTELRRRDKQSRNLPLASQGTEEIEVESSS